MISFFDGLEIFIDRYLCLDYYFNNAMRLEGDIMSRGKEVKELREKMGMNRREFSDYYGIPYRTVQDWEAEKRELPDYLLRLLKYRAEIERRIKSEDN